VEEYNAGFAVPPGLIDDLLKNFPGIELPGHLSVPGVHQLVLFVLLDGLHEPLGYPYGYVEIREFVVIGLAGDELKDVRMVDAKDPHIRPAPYSALFDRLRSGVKHLHERDRARRHAARGLDDIVLGP